MLFLKNIVALKNFDTTVKCHFGRISDTKMFFIRENHIFHTGLHFPDNILSPFISPAVSSKTGLELARELKNSNNPHLKSLPIIMITVDTKEKTVLDARNLGIQEYLVKPISPLALKKRILNAFGIKQERV